MGKAKASKGKKSKAPQGANGRSDAVLSGAAALGLEILTLEEAAALLRVTPEGLRTDAEKGTVPARNVGGEWRFFTHALHTWLTHPQPVRLQSSDLGPPVGMERVTKSIPAGGRVNMMDLPYSDETPEEQNAYRQRMKEIRDGWDKVGGETAG